MSLRSSMACVMVVLCVPVGCDRTNPRPKGVETKPSPTSKTFPMKGVVRKVDVGSGEVTIAHEAIPGFMPAMTMPFTVKRKALLDDVRPGDEVEGPLEVSYAGADVKDIELADLTVTKAAPAILPSILEAASPPPSTLKPGELVPDFEVTTQEGRTLRLSELRGEVVVLTFIYTRCPSPEFCPAMDAKFAELARRISTIPAREARVRLLSVSFDPGHDTPAVLTAHAARRGAKPPLWSFAVTSAVELAKIAGPIGLTYVPGTREIEHNLRAAVIGPGGELVRVEVGNGWAPADLLKVIYSAIPPDPK